MQLEPHLNLNFTNMKLDKQILIIDDKSQDTIMDTLKLELMGDVNLTYKQIQTSKPEFRADKSMDVDFEKLKLKIDSYYEEYHYFDLILTDFDLSDKNVDGLTVVEYIKEMKPTAKIAMYSANFTKVVQRVISTEKTKLSVQQVAQAVSKLVDYHLLDYIDRTDYRLWARKYFLEDKEVSIRDEFLKLLYNHKNMVFQACFPEFSNQTFGDIAKKIEIHSDARSDKWLLSMIEQTVAYLVKVNEL